MMSKHQKFIDFAYRLAKATEPVAGARVASCIVYKGDIISFGTNSQKTHPFQARFSKNPQSICLHAEISAIKNSLYRLTLDELSRSTIYIARAKFPRPNAKFFIQGLAEPCEGCKMAISEFNIKKVIYTMNNSGFGELQ